MSRLKDTFGRTIDDLRISLTDRCNFRCVYCMPAEGLPWLPKREILTYEEILRLARIFIGLGIRTVRLTGGEPLMRQDIDVLIEGLIRLDAGLDLSMTTNGFFLVDKVDRLVQAGLKRINVSLDSLQPARFERMVRRDGQLVFKILEGMRRARAAGLSPIKVNCVVMRGYNDDELVEMTPKSIRIRKAIRILQQFDGIVEQASEAELAEAAAEGDLTGLYNCPHTAVALAALKKLESDSKAALAAIGDGEGVTVRRVLIRERYDSDVRQARANAGSLRSQLTDSITILQQRLRDDERRTKELQQ